MTALTHAYATVDDLREHLGESKPGNLPENLLIRALNAASRAVDNYTDRRFWQDSTVTTRTVQFGGDPYNLLLPGDAEISDATGLALATDDGSGTFPNAWTVGTDFRLSPYDANTESSRYKAWWLLEGTGTRRFDVRGASWGVWRQSSGWYYPVQVTARFGWSSVPPEVEEATLLKAAALFKRKDAPFGVMQFGDIAAVRVTRQDIDVIELLAPYQRDVAMVG